MRHPWTRTRRPGSVEPESFLVCWRVWCVPGRRGYRKLLADAGFVVVDRRIDHDDVLELDSLVGGVLSAFPVELPPPERRHEFASRVGRRLAPDTRFTEHVRVSMLLGRTTSPSRRAADPRASRRPPKAADIRQKSSESPNAPEALRLLGASANRPTLGPAPPVSAAVRSSVPGPTHPQDRPARACRRVLSRDVGLSSRSGRVKSAPTQRA
jgi:hypothetical protein